MTAKVAAPVGDGLKAYYQGKIEELELAARDKAATLRRLEAQRNELNSKGASNGDGGRFSSFFVLFFSRVSLGP